MSARIDSERERIRRAKARVMSKKVAAFLSDLSDDLVAEDITNEAIVAILVAATPAVIELTADGVIA